MVALEFAANREAEFDVSDGLAGVITLIGQSLTALDTETEKKPNDTPHLDDAPNLEAIHQQTQRYFRAMGKRIDQMRRERRMSQKEMGRILGLSQQTVFNILIGERRLRLDLIAVLARAFGVSADELLGIKEMPLPLQPEPIAERLLRHLDTLQTLSEGDQRFVLKLAETIAVR